MSSPSSPSPKINLSIPLPFTPHTTLHLQITPLTTSTLIFMTTTSHSNSSSSLSALGSFVYAMPNRYTPSDPLCTSLVSISHTIDFASRTAKILARKTEKPVYLTCSVDLGLGASVEEELDALRRGVEGVMGALRKGG